MEFVHTEETCPIMDTYKKGDIVTIPESVISHVCGNCKHYAEYDGVCCCYKSEHVADFTSPDDGCCCWRKKEDA